MFNFHKLLLNLALGCGSILELLAHLTDLIENTYWSKFSASSILLIGIGVLLSLLMISPGRTNLTVSNFSISIFTYKFTNLSI